MGSLSLLYNFLFNLKNNVFFLKSVSFSIFFSLLLNLFQFPVCFCFSFLFSLWFSCYISMIYIHHIHYLILVSSAFVLFSLSLSLSLEMMNIEGSNRAC